MDRNVSLGERLRSIRVALREGGVDRNIFVAAVSSFVGVALREGGVDRNRHNSLIGRPPGVALREGGVDRNHDADRVVRLSRGRPPRGGRGSQLEIEEEVPGIHQSPSARGAWIATPA